MYILNFKEVFNLPLQKKFKNKKVKYKNEVFDSKLELEFFLYLLDLQKQGIVNDIIRQPKFILQEKFRYNGKAIREISYTPDFIISYTGDKTTEIVDIKGFLTIEYRLKAKMFKHYLIKTKDKRIFCEVYRKNGHWQWKY